MDNKERLQKELGDEFRVLRWINNAYFRPDEIVIERKQDRRYEVFRVEKEMTKDPFFMKAFSTEVTMQFANIGVQNHRRVAFEHIVLTEKLPLPLDRVSNNTRYESMETEWAYRFYCKGLTACVGWPTGNEQQPSKSA